MKEETKRCPLLREERVIYCKAFPLKKMLPLEKIFKHDCKCFKRDYRNCPVYNKKMVVLEKQGSVCPFLGLDLVVFCRAFPLKKITSNSITPSPCNSIGYKECGIYKGMVFGKGKGSLKNMYGFLLDETKNYLDGHIWVMRTNGLAKIGLDDFGQFLLGQIKRIFTPQKGERVEKGKPFLKCEIEEGEFELEAPLDGIVERVNEKILQLPFLVNADPYGDGWLLEIKLQGEIRELTFLKKEEIIERDVKRLREILEDNLGLNMADGGEFIRDIRPLLKEKAMVLIHEFLKGKEV